MSTPKPRWGILIVLSLALAIIIIDTTILNVSLATIIRELHTDIQSLQWVITAYALTLAALTITGGRFGDLFGRKRMFMFGAILFAIGSFVASISHSVSTLIMGESIIEGIGAALMMPATSSLIIVNFKGRDRAVAFGVWGGIAAAASAIGPILGGYLTTNYSWRWAFRINIFVTLILLLGAAIIPESKDNQEKPSLDLVGVVLSAVGLLGIVFGFIESSSYGWLKAKQTFMVYGHALSFGSYSVVPWSIAVGAVILVLFVLWELSMAKRGKTPLVSMKLFMNRQFTTGVVTTMIMTLGLSGLIFSIPVFLQAVRNLDAFHTGLTLLPMSLTLLVAAPLSANLGHTIRAKYLILAGLFLNMLAFLVLRAMINPDATTATFVPGLMLFGFGMGLVLSQISNLTLSAVSIEQAGEASGVNNTMRQVGSSLGSAIIGSVLLTALATNLGTGINNSTVIPETIKPQLSQAVSSQVSNVEFSGGAQVAQNIPANISDEITTISHQATVDANKSALGYGALFALIGILSAFFLPNRKNLEQEKSIANG